MSPKTILIVEDEPGLLDVLGQFARDLGHRPVMVETCSGARAALAAEPVDLLVLDNTLPDGQGVNLFRELHKERPELPVIFLTGEDRVELAVEVMRLGARDFLLKPLDRKAMTRAVAACLRPPAEPTQPGARRVVGDSPAIRDVWRQVDLFAPTDITVLLLGESGTGKELFARAIHARSKRAAGPFVEMDCASIPASLIEAELFGYEKGAFTDAKENRQGKFELASGGTLFLDELGNLSLEVQAKLLRVVQERCFRRIGGHNLVNADVRIVGATNLDLEESVRRGGFRGDLYYRLGEMPVRLPALRDRAGDVARLVEAFVEEFGACYNKPVAGVTHEAMSVLTAFDWPGNVRELANVVRIGVLTCDQRIDVAQLPAYLLRGVRGAPAPAPVPPAASAAAADGESMLVQIPWPSMEAGLDLKGFTQQVKVDVERRILRRLVEDLKFNKAQMARYLKVDYKVVVDKLKAHGF